MPKPGLMKRRSLVALSGAALAAAAFGSPAASSAGRFAVPMGPSERDLASRYAARTDGGHRLPGVPFQKIDPKYYRQRVENLTGEPGGVVVVDVANRFLYLTEDDGTAMRYGIGIGRAGFTWSGEGVIQWRQKWPRWTPPPEMIARQPELRKYSYANGGQAPGPNNPLGARALYIFQNGKDTLYRLHGTRDWRSIGNAVSSGCVRLINQDVIDLYERVPAKARIVVWQQGGE
ncbi:L,D-transpeptidase [Ochrobactrum sp. XJ1]|nr:L,D-transpeptidase [Ochrobactrum sp. XJ1]